jgi:hypothetical protein
MRCLKLASKTKLRVAEMRAVQWFPLRLRHLLCPAPSNSGQNRALSTAPPVSGTSFAGIGQSVRRKGSEPERMQRLGADYLELKTKLAVAAD